MPPAYVSLVMSATEKPRLEKPALLLLLLLLALMGLELWTLARHFGKLF
jgi:hypothetical protein